MRNAGKYEKCKKKASGMATFVLCSGCSVRALFSTIPHLLVVCGRVRGWVRVGCGSGRGGWGLWLWVQHTWFSVFYRNKGLDAACCEVTARLRVLAERV